MPSGRIDYMSHHYRPEGIAMRATEHTNTGSVPTPLRRSRDDVQMWAGIIVGGVLMLVTVGLLIYALTLS